MASPCWQCDIVEDVRCYALSCDSLDEGAATLHGRRHAGPLLYLRNFSLQVCDALLACLRLGGGGIASGSGSGGRVQGRQRWQRRRAFAAGQGVLMLGPVSQHALLGLGRRGCVEVVVGGGGGGGGAIWRRRLQDSVRLWRLQLLRRQRLTRLGLLHVLLHVLLRRGRRVGMIEREKPRFHLR